MNLLADAATMAIGMALMLAVPGYFVLQIWAPFRLAGGWRKAALAPLVLAVPIALWCAHAYAAQSNLWPLTFVFFAPIGSLYLAVILAAANRSRAN